MRATQLLDEYADRLASRIEAHVAARVEQLLSEAGGGALRRATVQPPAASMPTPGAAGVAADASAHGIATQIPHGPKPSAALAGVEARSAADHEQAGAKTRAVDVGQGTHPSTQAMRSVSEDGVRRDLLAADEVDRSMLLGMLRGLLEA